MARTSAFSTRSTHDPPHHDGLVLDLGLIGHATVLNGWDARRGGRDGRSMIARRDGSPVAAAADHRSPSKSLTVGGVASQKPLVGATEEVEVNISSIASATSSSAAAVG